MFRITRLKESKGINRSDNGVGYKFQGESLKLSKSFLKEISTFRNSVISFKSDTKILITSKKDLKISDNHVIILFSVFYDMVMLGYKVRVDSNMGKYLQKINIYRFLPIDKKKLAVKELSRSSSKLFFGFVNYSELDSDYISVLFKRVMRVLTKKNYEKIPDEITTPIGEGMFNASEHSDGKYHFFSNKVSKENDEILLEYNIIDFGVTIPGKIIKYLKSSGHEVTDSIEAMKWAISRGNTTRNNKQGGNGFTTLEKCVLDNKGEMVIISGEIMYTRSIDDEKFIKLAKEFPGTILKMKVTLDDLSERNFTDSEKKVSEVSLIGGSYGS